MAPTCCLNNSKDGALSVHQIWRCYCLRKLQVDNSVASSYKKNRQLKIWKIKIAEQSFQEEIVIAEARNANHFMLN